jgi:uncharacterized membrane protein
MVAVCSSVLTIGATFVFSLAILSVEDFMTFMFLLMFSVNVIAYIPQVHLKPQTF